MSIGMHPVRNERRELRTILGLGALAVGFILWFGSRDLTDQIQRGVATVPLLLTRDEGSVANSNGEAVGFGGSLRPEVPVDALPSDVVAMLRIGDLSTTLALSVAALTIVALSLHVLKKGLFETGTSRRLRLGLVSPVAIWFICLHVGNHGASRAAEALDLPEAFWGTSDFGGAIGPVVVLYFLGLAWVEVTLRAGRRLAKDQEGVI